MALYPVNYFWEIKIEGFKMRVLYSVGVFVSLVLFSCNHAHARIGEIYEHSVKRYTAAVLRKLNDNRRHS